ncbi:hypothetical protein B0H10DRAFT_316792 [Mycena sp. CBHHK59/15]|nr:hypothetical protein B0H10DRAFT_316792 [Mycena sp. CBHHK59/15]
MDDPQWCLDECPTCATVVHGTSIYCSSKCEPRVEVEENESYVPWTESTTARVSAWALHCHKATIVPTMSPSLFPSPSGRKIHLRKQRPTVWVTSDLSFDSPPCTSPTISTSAAALSLVASSAGPASSTGPIRSWASPLPAPPTCPLLTKTNVYLFSNGRSSALCTDTDTAPLSDLTSNGDLVPELWFYTKAECVSSIQSDASVLKRPPWDGRTGYTPRDRKRR